MINITNEQWQVLINIIGAVETGSQIYGQRNYSDYTEAYTNSNIEVSITIGAFQEYNELAKGLLQDIQDKYPNVFAKYDNADIAEDLKMPSWNGYSPSKNSKKAKAIVNIISTNEGKKVQDERILAQMKQYVAYGESKGVTNVSGMFEVCNIAHQGGYVAVDRILAKTAKPYTADTIYAALCTDTGANQVGTYVNRQAKVYQWLKQYLPKEETIVELQPVYNITPGTSANDILNIMRGWLGLSRQTGTHRVIIDTYNSYLPHPRSYAVTYFDDYCCASISAAFIKANAVSLIGGIECSVERIIEDCFKPKGIWHENENTYLPKSGDIICFDWQTTNPQADATGWADHIGIVESVQNGYVYTIEGNTSGGIVARKVYPLDYACIRGYARPDYLSNSTTVITYEPVNPNTTTADNIDGDAVVQISDPELKIGSKGDAVKRMQELLIANGYSCGSDGADGVFGNETHMALLNFQTAHNLTPDGVYGEKSKAVLEGLPVVEEKKFPFKLTTIKTAAIRSGASKKKNILVKVPKDTTLKIIKEKTNSAGNLWYKVQYGTIKGWTYSGNF